MGEPQKRLAQAEQFRAEETRRARMTWWAQPDNPGSNPGSKIGLEDHSPPSPLSSDSRPRVQTLSSFLDVDSDGNSWCSPSTGSSFNIETVGTEVSVGTLAEFLSVGSRDNLLKPEPADGNGHVSGDE